MTRPRDAVTTHPEERYQAELLSTEITPRTAKIMSIAFVALLSVVPLSQTLIELARRQTPQALDVFRPMRTAVVSAVHHDLADAHRAISTTLSREFPKTFEQSLERASTLKTFVQPRIQEMLTAYARVGNDKAVAARNGWLFFQPGIDYVSGPSVIDASYLAVAAKARIDKQGEHSPHLDPRDALFALQRDCAAAGIHLILLPIPDKSMLESSRLTTRLDVSGSRALPNNRGYAQLVDELRTAGIDVFDPALSARPSLADRYLEQDTHWTPAFMDSVSADLARRIDATDAVRRSTEANPFALRHATASRVGDIVDLLKLTPAQRIYAPVSVEIDQVIEPSTGQTWKRDPNADVLLLGDSFTNIYSQPEMGWGEAAGFAEHLSFHLGRAVDVIALNGAGGSAVREEASRLASSRDAWSAKVLVYEFSMRFLMGEDWKIVPFAPRMRRDAKPPLPTGGARPATQPTTKITAANAVPPKTEPALSPNTPVEVVARVLQVSRVPAPDAAPYKDCLTYVRLHVERVVAGRLIDTEVIGAFVAMVDNKWTPAASYAVGDTLRITMIPMESAERRLQTMQRADNLNDFTHRVFVITKEAIQ